MYLDLLDFQNSYEMTVAVSLIYIFMALLIVK